MAEADATVSLFDRGFLFADGIYEVTAVIDGQMVDNDLHLARLRRSLNEVSIPLPVSEHAIVEIQTELIARNGLREGVVYLQVTRGAADRNFDFAHDIVPTFIAFTQSKNIVDPPALRNGIAVATMPDSRWARRDIKSTMLLAQILAKKSAKEGGFQEAWFTEDGYVTEGASSTAYIVTKDDVVITRPNSRAVLPGCTKRSVLKLAGEGELRVEERLFTVDEAFNANEAFLTSASSLVTPIIRIDDRIIGTGKPGPLTSRLLTMYLDMARRGAASETD